MDYSAFFNEFIDADHPEITALTEREGPPYQYAGGYLSDGALGYFMAFTARMGPVVDEEKLDAHLGSVMKYNYRGDLLRHANPQRGGFALGNEAGLLVCTWPDGDRPVQPLLYSNEVWTGLEYEVAAQLARRGKTQETLHVVRAARARYDGRLRNPFDEYECGHWYGRAQASYGLLQAFTGIRYDAPTKTLFVAPAFEGDLSSFLSTETGYGVAGVRGGAPFLSVYAGVIAVERVEYEPAFNGNG